MRYTFFLFLIFSFSVQLFSQTTEITEPEIILVEGGWYKMGCTFEQKQDCMNDEYPVKDIQVFDFWIGKYEVTNKQFAEFLSSVGNQKEGGDYWYRIDKYSLIEQYSDGLYKPKEGFENFPASNISWFGAQAYVKWLRNITQKPYRLPTESEWEYAARGGNKSNGFLYSGSNNIEEVGWSFKFAANSKTGWNFKFGVGTHPVGTKAPNELGIYDMSGNLREWCSNAYDNSYSKPFKNSGTLRVLRGGSWDNNILKSRVSSRNFSGPVSSFAVNKGFRVVMDPNIKPDLDRFAEEKGFSGTILVSKGSSIIYKNSFDLSHQSIEISSSSYNRFPIASITKLFTSVIVLQLVEEGKLNLHETISKYLASYSGEGADKVTIHHLLTHTSGIQNSEMIKANDSELPAILLEEASSDELLSKYSSGELVNNPGKTYSYNNGEYIILGKIIEQVSNKPFDEVLKEKILMPLNMRNSGIIKNSSDKEDLHFTESYSWDMKTESYTKDPEILIQNFYSSGAMFSTAEDLLKFSNALYNGNLIEEHSLELLLTTYVESQAYGYGQWIRYTNYKKNVLKSAERYGRIFGLNTLLSHYLGSDITLIVLSNTNKVSPGSIHNFVGEVLFNK